MHQNPTNHRILTLLMSALGLLGVTLVLATGILMAMTHPEWLAPAQPALAEAAPPAETTPVQAVVDGRDVETGFIAQGDYELVKATCTACHSSKLVTQNRATRDGWLEMIRWMQRTQKLWDLGDNEAAILDYLAKHYGPEDQGRRAPVEVEQWYPLAVEAPPRGGAPL